MREPRTQGHVCLKLMEEPNTFASISSSRLVDGRAEHFCLDFEFLSRWWKSRTLLPRFRVLVQLMEKPNTFASISSSCPATSWQWWSVSWPRSLCARAPTGSPSRGGDVAGSVFDLNQPSLPTPFYSVLVSVSVFMVLSAVFHSMNSPDNSPLSHSVLAVLCLPDWSFQLYISLCKSPSALI